MMTAERFWDTLPHCCGYPKCDGDLEATPHSKECPLFGKKEMDAFVFASAYAAELRESWKEAHDAVIDMENECKELRERIAALEKK